VFARAAAEQRPSPPTASFIGPLQLSAPSANGLDYPLVTAESPQQIVCMDNLLVADNGVLVTWQIKDEQLQELERIHASLNFRSEVEPPHLIAPELQNSLRRLRRRSEPQNLSRPAADSNQWPHERRAISAFWPSANSISRAPSITTPLLKLSPGMLVTTSNCRSSSYASSVCIRPQGRARSLTPLPKSRTPVGHPGLPPGCGASAPASTRPRVTKPKRGTHSKRPCPRPPVIPTTSTFSPQVGTLVGSRGGRLGSLSTSATRKKPQPRGRRRGSPP
jgi:hypothetical protein